MCRELIIQASSNRIRRHPHSTISLVPRVDYLLKRTSLARRRVTPKAADFPSNPCPRLRRLFVVLVYEHKHQLSKREAIMKEQSNTFLYIFRGGAEPAQMSPEQMQARCCREQKARPSRTDRMLKEKKKWAATSSSRPRIWSMRRNWRKGALSLKTMAPWKCGRFKRCPRLRSPCAGANSARDPAFADEL